MDALQGRAVCALDHTDRIRDMRRNFEPCGGVEPTELFCVLCHAADTALVTADPSLADPRLADPLLADLRF